MIVYNFMFFDESFDIIYSIHLHIMIISHLIGQVKNNQTKVEKLSCRTFLFLNLDKWALQKLGCFIRG